MYDFRTMPGSKAQDETMRLGAENMALKVKVSKLELKCEKLVQGIPNGWELVRVGLVEPGEWMVDGLGLPQRWVGSRSSGSYAIIRRIHKPNQRVLMGKWVIGVDISEEDVQVLMRRNDGYHIEECEA